VKITPDGNPIKSSAGKQPASDAEVSFKAEKNRMAELELIAAAITASDIGVFYWDVVSGTTCVAGAWRNIMCVGADEKVDYLDELRIRVHSEDLQRVTSAHQDCIDGRTSRMSVEYRLRACDGQSWLWMRSEAAASERDSKGKALMIIGTQRDITDKKEAELALRRSEKRFRSLMENAPIGTAIGSLDGTLIATNSALQNFLGYSEAALTKTNYQVLTHPDDWEASAKNLKMLLKGQADSFEMEKRFIRADGKIAWGYLSVVVVRAENGQPLHYISQLMDVTERHRLELLKQEFISLVGHELRTPLTAIMGALALIDVGISDRPIEDVQKLVGIAKRGGDRLRRLLDDILDFQMLSEGNMSLSLVEADVVRIIEDALTEAQPILDQHQVSISLTAQDSSIGWRCDPTLLRKVLSCLISNAAKYSPEGSEAWIGVTRERDGLHVRVKDQGRGIPPALHDEVFEPFWQQDPSDTREHQGIGLGLSISRHIVRQMGGELSIKTVEGPGAEFLISLPA